MSKKHNEPIIVRAPGKVLLLGGYAVLDRPHVAWVVAVNKYVQATLLPRNDAKIELEMPDFGIRLEGKDLQFSGTAGQLQKARFVLQTIRTVSRYLEAKGMKRMGFGLRTESDPAFALNSGKSGLGSSAAVTVAATAALLQYHGIDDLNIIHKIAQVAHAQAQEKIGSGFDVAAACFGSIEYIRYSPDLIQLDKLDDSRALVRLIEISWDYKIAPAPLLPPLQMVVANIPGASASTTRMVKQLLEWRREQPDRYAQLVGMINQADKKALEGMRQKDLEWFALNFSMSRKLTHKLGQESGVEIEPDDLTIILNESFAKGALAGKLPGAGGGDSIVALVTSDLNRKKLGKFWKFRGLELIDLEAVASGLEWGPARADKRGRR